MDRVLKVSDNFSLHELVPTHIFEKWGERAVWFIQPRIINVAQTIRDHFCAPMMINGNGMQYRGFRDDSFYYNSNGTTKRNGGFLSQHRFGNAIDFNITGFDCAEIRAEILKNRSKFIAAGLTTIESGDYAPTWVHVDARHTDLNEIIIVKP